MSFVQPQRSAARSTAGIGVAVLFHIVLLWALMNGLGRKVMQVINAPIETKIIEEVKPPPPPPKVIELPPPPKFAPPPPAYVPPVEVKVQAPATPQPTITATVAEAPPAPPVVKHIEPAPAPAPAPAPTPAPAPVPVPPPVKAPAPVSASVACANYGKVMGDAGFPREAQRAGLEEGSALIQFTLTASGEINDVKAVEASHAAFARGAMRIVGEYRCTGQGRDVVVQVPFKFRSN